MNKEEEVKFKKKIKEETISREDELIDAAKRNAAIVSEFIKGAEWADQNPKKGLWNAKKVCKVLKDYMFKERFFDNRMTRTAIIDNVVCNLIKAMED